MTIAELLVSTAATLRGRALPDSGGGVERSSLDSSMRAAVEIVAVVYGPPCPAGFLPAKGQAVASGHPSETCAACLWPRSQHRGKA